MYNHWIIIYSNMEVSLYSTVTDFLQLSENGKLTSQQVGVWNQTTVCTDITSTRLSVFYNLVYLVTATTLPCILYNPGNLITKSN